MKIVLVHLMVSVNSEKQIVVPSDRQQQLDIEQLVMNIRIDDLDLCQETSSENCEILIEQLVHCEQIIFTDSSFSSSSHYEDNFIQHEQILTKYQSLCNDTHTNSLINELFHFNED